MKNSLVWFGWSYRWFVCLLLLFCYCLVQGEVRFHKFEIKFCQSRSSVYKEKGCLVEEVEHI